MMQDEPVAGDNHQRSCETVAPSPPSLGETTRLWLKVGLLSFGGPAAQIALMHRLVVDERRWIDDARFLHALNFCMLLPGPEAQQLAIYLGWLLHRTVGGLIAGILFVLPGAMVMLGLSIVYVLYHHLPLIDGVFYGLKAAVLAIVIDAVIRIGKRALRTTSRRVVASLAFLAIFFLDAPFPLIVLAAGVIGYFTLARSTTSNGGGDDRDDPVASFAMRAPTLREQAKQLLAGVAVWFTPTLLSALMFGWHGTFTQIGLFFSHMAVVTFGGAYAVLAYVAQQAVEVHGWLTSEEMLTGLGLAETTPGPLILVLQFVGFLGGYRDPNPFPAMSGGILGAFLASWVTFTPSFIWIFLGAPYVERLRHHRRLSSALASITAAVVGVVLNLAMWFALHVLFLRSETQWLGPVRLIVPDLSSLDLTAFALTIAAMISMLAMKIGLMTVLSGCAAIGLAIRLF